MQYNQKTLDGFKKEFYNKFPDSDIEILKYNKWEDIIIKTKYGLNRGNAGLLLKGCKPSIFSAINPTEYFINQAKEVHGDKYDYNLVYYEKSSKKVKIICKKHGIFEQIPNSHLQGFICEKCGRINTSMKLSSNTKEFIKKAEIIHGDRYDYSKVDYTLAAKKVIIYCNIHNISFVQSPRSHLKGAGCPKCRTITLSKYHTDNPTGWSKTNWFKAAERSKIFDGFKVYIIKCWNEEEEFYKIGRTFTEIRIRFYGRLLPYEYEILQLFEFKELTEENCRKCYDLETELHRKNKKNKYLPKLEFNGRNECFKIIYND